MQLITITTTTKVAPEMLRDWVRQQPNGSWENDDTFGLFSRDTAAVFVDPNTSLMFYEAEGLETARTALGAEPAAVVNLSISASRGSEPLAHEVAQQIKDKWHGLTDEEIFGDKV